MDLIRQSSTYKLDFCIGKMYLKNSINERMFSETGQPFPFPARTKLAE
jgi:hypothetical protein